MRRRRPAARRAAVIALVAIVLVGLARDARAQTELPDTLPDLAFAFAYSFLNILTEEELELFVNLAPEDLKAANRIAYEKVSQNIVHWTDEWLRHVAPKLETIPPERLDAAEVEAQRVNDLLRAWFDEQGWEYRSMRVVFLPQRLLHNSYNRRSRVRGMVIPYYPGAFFASVDRNAATAHILVHETIHYNKTGARYPRPLREGITEAATRRFVALHELSSSKEMRREEYYVDERKRVDVILDAMVERTNGTHDEALDVLLEAYLTGDQSGMEAIFGVEAWQRVLALPSQGDWYKKEIRKALEPAS